MSDKVTMAEVADKVVSSEEMQQLVQWIKSSAEKSGDFFAEQAPLVIQEILTWGLISSLAGFFLCLVLTIGFTVPGVKLLKEGYKKNDFEYQLFGAIMFTFALASSIGVPVNASNALYIYFAPRLYLMEELSKFL